MDFGLNKWAAAVFKYGKLTKSQNISLIDQTVIKNLEPDEECKYLGTDEGYDIDNSQMKEKLVKEYYRRVRQILKTELNSKNKNTTINTLAVPVLVYSFGIVNLLRKGTEKVDRKTRKLITTEGIHHPNADVNRLYIKRQNGGHGLIKIESVYNAAIVGLSEYINPYPANVDNMASSYQC